MDPDNFSEWIEQLDSEDSSRKQAAALLKRAWPESANLVWQARKAQSAKVRHACLWLISSCGHPKADVAMVEALDDPSERIKALATSYLRERLKHQSPKRLHALMAKSPDRLRALIVEEAVARKQEREAIQSITTPPTAFRSKGLKRNERGGNVWYEMPTASGKSLRLVPLNKHPVSKKGWEPSIADISRDRPDGGSKPMRGYSSVYASELGLSSRGELEKCSFCSEWVPAKAWKAHMRNCIYRPKS